MNQYIDSDKLIAEIKRYKNKADERLKIKGRSYAEEEKDSALQNLCGNLLHFISSLQQEQPEVDLEKEAVSFCFDNGINLSPRQAKNIARHFYELGLNARKEE